MVVLSSCSNRCVRDMIKMAEVRVTEAECDTELSCVFSFKGSMFFFLLENTMQPPC